MSLCFETLKVVDGRPLHVNYHNARCNRTRREVFFCQDFLDLETVINAPKIGAYRCRVVYGKNIEKVEFFPLVSRMFESFTCKAIDFEYPHKWLERKAIDKAKEGIMTDDVLFTCKERLLDTSIANIALCISGQWMTPKTPLLKGTARARFLEEGWLKEEDLSIYHLREAENFAIMNALLGFREINNLIMEGL